jgi:DNA-binding transcriptional MerR regulator
MKPVDQAEESGRLTIGRLAQLLGCSTENVRALERRRRLPEGCEPAIDEITNTRYWTPEQANRLKQWNDERQKQALPTEPDAPEDPTV